MKQIIIFVIAIVLTSCVSQKKHKASETQYKNQIGELNDKLKSTDTDMAGLKSQLKTTETELLVSQTNLANERNRNNGLDQQVAYFKNTNDNLLDRLSDLSVVSKSGAESIRKSLNALSEQNQYIKGLTSNIQRKDSLNLVLVMNLKRSLSDFNDEDINIEVKKGVVYVSISDKMLFASGSSTINAQAEQVLGKIAKVVNDHNGLDILVEGHTDNVPIANSCVTDNWDLSVKRATSVVRLLQNKFGVKPERMTAGGRAEFVPKASNETISGKAMNRRTEIVILPKLEEFFQLLEPPLEVLNNNR
ncbi:MAG: OmpA family protein [Cyclobacteriaceae bacterium]